jgi:hypothetical protein
MKEAAGKEMMSNKNLILLTRTTRMSSEELFHQEGLSQPSTKIYILSYCFSCNNFGHKALDFRAYVRSDHVRNRNRGSYKT